jgi:hypothetical protein
MKLTNDAYVERYRELYQARYGKQLSAEEATEQANKLLMFFQWLYRPMSKDEFDTMRKMAEAKPPSTTEHKEEGEAQK